MTDPKITVDLYAVEISVKGAPRFESHGRTWQLTELTIRYAVAGGRWNASTGWSGKAYLIKKDDSLGGMYREVGPHWGATPEISAWVAEIAGEIDPRASGN